MLGLGLLRGKKTTTATLGDVFEIQRDIVLRTTSQLKATVSPTEKAAIDERPTKDLVAYGLYVRAKALIATISLNTQINEKLREAVQLADQAIARDPDFFLAYCQLASAHNYFIFSASITRLPVWLWRMARSKLSFVCVPTRGRLISLGLIFFIAVISTTKRRAPNSPSPNAPCRITRRSSS